VVQRLGKGIALLFHDHDTRRTWVVSSTTRPHFTPGKEPVLIVKEAGWATGPVWTGGKSRSHRDSIPDFTAPSQSLYRLSYPAQRWGSYTLTLSPRNNFILPKLLNYYSNFITVPFGDKFSFRCSCERQKTPFTKNKTRKITLCLLRIKNHFHLNFLYEEPYVPLPTPSHSAILESITKPIGGTTKKVRIFRLFILIIDMYLIKWTAVAQWLRRCATNRKVAGSIPPGFIGIFPLTYTFRSHYGPGVDSASNRNEYQEYFLGVKAAGA